MTGDLVVRGLLLLVLSAITIGLPVLAISGVVTHEIQRRKTERRVNQLKLRYASLHAQVLAMAQEDAAHRRHVDEWGYLQPRPHDGIASAIRRERDLLEQIWESLT
jgi:hypothetical protein